MHREPIARPAPAATAAFRPQLRRIAGKGLDVASWLRLRVFRSCDLFRSKIRCFACVWVLQWFPERTSFITTLLLCSFFVAQGPPVSAADLCREPADVDLTLAREGVGIVIVEADQDRASPAIRRGDRVKQINGLAVAGCDDVDRAIASARRRSVALLMLVERRGEKIPVLVRLGSSEARAAARPSQPASVAAPPRPRARPVPTPDVVSRGRAMLVVISRLEQAAVIHGPLVTYARRVSEAEDTIRGLAPANGEAGRALTDLVAEILDYHHAAERMWRLKTETASDLRYDRRAVGKPLPYFSGSEVEAWLVRYPVFRGSIISEPHEVKAIMPGEGAGLWDPDRALALMWGRAREARRELEDWLAGARPPGARRETAPAAVR